MNRALEGMGLGCLAVILLACSAAGQGGSVTPGQQPSVETMLAEFARYYEAAATGVRPLPPNPRLLGVLIAPTRFSPETVTGVLGGLERMAVESADGSVRVAAVSWLAGAGEVVGSPGATGLAGSDVAARLGRVLDRSSDAGVRDVILGRMWAQADRTEALRLLTMVAQSNQEDASRDFPEPYTAILSLSRMGAEGVSALHQLRASDAVKNRRARGLLEHLAERGYRPD